MNFIRKLSTQLLNEKSYNIIVRENSRNNIFCLKGNYKITTNINRYQYYIKKYEMHESHSPESFIKIKEKK